MVVVGGIGSAPGAILGALALTVAGEYLRVFETYRLIVYSLAIMGTLICLPRGLGGLLRPRGSGRGLGRQAPVAEGAAGG
jgi:branched-chain amino acid transport system permease protein